MALTLKLEWSSPACQGTWAEWCSPQRRSWSLQKDFCICYRTTCLGISQPLIVLTRSWSTNRVVETQWSLWKNEASVKFSLLQLLIVDGIPMGWVTWGQGLCRVRAELLWPWGEGEPCRTGHSGKAHTVWQQLLTWSVDTYCGPVAREKSSCMASWWLWVAKSEAGPEDRTAPAGSAPIRHDQAMLCVRGGWDTLYCHKAKWYFWMEIYFRSRNQCMIFWFCPWAGSRCL